MSETNAVPAVKWVRDMRDRNWFWADNEVFDIMGPRIKVNALATYLYLCRCADKDSQSCYPSYKRIGDATGTSRSTAKRSVQTLIEFGMIAIETRPHPQGDSDTNLFVILPRAAWKDGNAQGSVHTEPGRVTQNRPLLSENSPPVQSEPSPRFTQTPKQYEVEQEVFNNTKQQENVVVADANASPSDTAAFDELSAKLIALKVSPKDAARLARDFPGECARQIEYFPFQDKVKSQGAFLRRAIENDYAPPQKWIDEMDRREAMELAQRRAAEQQKAREQQQRQQREQMAASEVRAAELDKMYESLDASTQERIDKMVNERLGFAALRPNNEGAKMSMRRVVMVDVLGLQ